MFRWLHNNERYTYWFMQYCFFVLIVAIMNMSVLKYFILTVPPAVYLFWLWMNPENYNDF